MSTHTATQKATLRISLPHQQNPVQGGDKYVSIQMKFLPKHVQKHLSVPNKNICKEKHLSIEPEAEASKPDRNRYAPPCLGRRGFGMKATVLWAPRECATWSGREVGCACAPSPQAAVALCIPVPTC